MKQNTVNPSIWTILYGIIYGGVVASAYFFVGLRGQSDGGLSLFAATCAATFAIHAVIWPRQTFRGFCDRNMLLRGVLYGLTQVLILKAQSHGQTSTALVSSTMGSIFGVLLGRFVLKERVRGIAFVAVLTCTLAVLLDPMLIIRAHWGILGGIIQGSGFVLTRVLMLDKKSIRQSISSGVGVAFLVTMPTLIFSDRLLSGFTAIHLVDLSITTAILFIVQYGFFYLLKVVDSQRASILTLSRLPWIIAFEVFILGTAVGYKQAASASLIGCSALLLLLEARTRPSS